MYKPVRRFALSPDGDYGVLLKKEPVVSETVQEVHLSPYSWLCCKDSKEYAICFSPINAVGRPVYKYPCDSEAFYAAYHSMKVMMSKVVEEFLYGDYLIRAHRYSNGEWLIDVVFSSLQEAIEFQKPNWLSLELTRSEEHTDWGIWQRYTKSKLKEDIRFQDG